MINFSEIQDISSHGKICPLVRAKSRPVVVRNSFCFHIHTTERIYHALALPDMHQSEYVKWPIIIKQMVRSYKVKKEAKQVLKQRTKRASYLDSAPGVDIEEKLVSSETKTEQKRSSENETGSLRKNQNEEIENSDNDLVVSDYETEDEDEDEDEDEEESSVIEAFKTPPPALRLTDSAKPKFTFSSIKEEINKMNDEEAYRLLKELSAQYEKDGRLRKLFNAFLKENPKENLIKLSNVGNFQIAKFGVLQRLGENIQRKRDGV